MILTITKPASKPKATRIVLSGPFLAVARDHDRTYWTVFAADASNNAVGQVYRPKSFVRARWLATNMALDRRLDLVDETAAF
jgi:hypothetical protein